MIELLFAPGTAEMICLPVVLGVPSGGGRVYVHAAHWIFHNCCALHIDLFSSYVYRVDDGQRLNKVLAVVGQRLERRHEVLAVADGACMILIVSYPRILSFGQEPKAEQYCSLVPVRLQRSNVTDKYALYNFLFTVSGTHFVTSRSITARITLSF
jgi:hypothetical protein